VCDTRLLWCEVPFQALGALRTVVGTFPAEWTSLWKHRNRPLLPSRLEHRDAQYYRLHLGFPPGWARRSRVHPWKFFVRRQAKLGEQALKHLEGRMGTVVLALPHHLPVLDSLHPRVTTVYYMGDDYRPYANWSSSFIRELEEEIVQRVDIVFCAAEAVRDRFRREQPEHAAKLHVSRGATHATNIPARALTIPANLPSDIPSRLTRPVVGLVGRLGAGTNFALLRGAADRLPNVSFLLVGPVDNPVDPSEREHLNALRHCPHVWFAGSRPYTDLGRYVRAMDVCLLPYENSGNRPTCSPWRLFDYLAASRPIVATSVCDQLKYFANAIRFGDTPDEFAEAIEIALSLDTSREACEYRWELARNNTWEQRATEMLNLIESLSR